MRKHKSFLALYVLIILACAMGANVQAQPTTRVEISDNSFQPDIISIPAGTTVIWTNDDTTDHTVTSDDSAFHSGYIAPGGHYSRLFDTPGDYPYHCNIHPFMRSMIHVEPKPSSTSANTPNAYQSAVSTEATQNSATQYAQYPQYAQNYQTKMISGASSYTHITNPKEYDIQSNPPAYLYFRDQEQAVPYNQYQTYAEQEEGNFLWVQGTPSWSQYATAPEGTSVSLIASTPTGGNGYLYETYPDGHTIKNYYYFFPYSQLGINLDTVGQHKLFFSKDDQMSNSIVIDVTGSNQLSNVQPEYQQPGNPQPSYVQQNYQQSNYQQSNYQQSTYNYGSQGYQQSEGQQESYNLQPKPQAKETPTEYSSFLEESMVRQDSNGRLTSDGIQGTDFDLQSSNENILTRGLLYGGTSYILVANPNSASYTVTVNPGLSIWNVQCAQVQYGNLMIAKANNLLQITVPAHQSGLIIIQPQRKRYSFSIGPKPAYSISVGPKPAYSFSAGPKPAYSFRAGPTPQYSFRAGY